MFVAHGDLAEFYNNLCRNSVILKSDVNHPSGILQTRPYDASMIAGQRIIHQTESVVLFFCSALHEGGTDVGQ